MGFISRKIEEKSSPFLKEKSFKNPKLRVFFGPEIVRPSRQRPIFSKNFFIWLIVLIIVLLYLSLGIVNLFSPPKIVIESPPENYITTEKIITVKGRASGHKAIITINNQIVNLSEKNIFEERVSLSPGVNTIKISARKKFGPERTIFRQIIVK